MDYLSNKKDGAYAMFLSHKRHNILYDRIGIEHDSNVMTFIQSYSCSLISRG